MDILSRRSQEFEADPKALQLPSINLVTQNDVNYLGLDTRQTNSSFSGWIGNSWLINTILRRKKDESVQYTAFSKPATWLASDTSKRTEIKRKAYEALFNRNHNETVSIKVPGQGNATQQISVEDILTALSTNSIEQLRANWLKSKDDTVGKLIKGLQKEDDLVFTEFQRTLIDAEPNGMVGTFVQGRRNPHLAQILSNFTLLYANSPQGNPLLHNVTSAENPTDYLRAFAPQDTPSTVMDRIAIENYMEHIRKEITKLIKMPPEAFDMAFSEDNHKHKTIVKVLKRAFNRLAAEIDYGFRFENRLNGFGYEVCPVPNSVDEMESGKLYYDADNYSILDSANNPVTVPHNLNLVAVDHADFPKFKADLLSLAARNGHVFTEKSNDYARVATQRKTEADHKKLQSKLNMRSIKKTIFWTAAVLAIIIAAGQVAIAVFATTGSLAIAIGFSCALTNTLLFWRDIAAVLTAFFRGDLIYGMSWPLKVFLGIFFSFSLSTGIISGGFAFSALAAFATSPALLLVASVIAAVSIVGMASMFFMVGVAIAKGLRGKTFTQVRTESWTSFKGFFKTPEYNYELVKLKNDITKLMAANVGEAYTYDVHKKILQKRKQITLLKFEHNLRHWLKVIFATVLVPAALVATIIAAYAISKSSVDGTAKLIQLALKWSDSASLAVASVLSWVPGFVVNFGLTLNNLSGVALLLGAKVAQIPAAIFYGIGMVGVILHSGRAISTISESVTYYWNNFTKEVVLPGSRIVLGLGVLVLVVLNGYGNGATLGQQGAFSLEWLPTRMLAWLEKMAPATMETLKNSFGVVTTIVGTSSSIALNANACRDFSMDYSVLSAPIKRLDSQDRETHQQMVDKLEAQNAHGIGFFDRKCAQYDHNVIDKVDPDNYNPLTELEPKFQD